MKVLLVSDGEHEGSGALEAIVRRIIPSVESCKWHQQKDIHVHPGKGGRFLKKAVRLMQEVHNEGCDALVMVIDEDGDSDRVRQFNDAQAEAVITFGTRRALGVAIRSFDAWNLADEKALSSVISATISTQPAPEENRDPKRTCRQLIQDSNSDLSLRRVYMQTSPAWSK